MTCRVEDWVDRTLVSADEGATVQEAVERMAAHAASFLLVTRQGALVGLFTEQDLLRRVVGKGLAPGSVNVGEVCTRNLISIAADSNCLRAIATMQAHRCRRLVVYHGQQLLGVVNLIDLAHAVAHRGRGQDLLVNVMGLVTVTVAVGVIAVLLAQLPEVVQFVGGLNGR